MGGYSELWQRQRQGKELCDTRWWAWRLHVCLQHFEMPLWELPSKNPPQLPALSQSHRWAQSTQPTGLLVLPCRLWIADAIGARLMFISSFCICFCLQDCCCLAGYGDELASSFHCGIQDLSTCTEISSVLLPNNKHSGRKKRINLNCAFFTPLARSL